MREDYLHHLFQMRRLGNSFQTTIGSVLEVQKFGQLNPNAGPDFLESQIALEGHTWAGSIEFHVKSSDWFLHGHQADNRYNNVIAHFVYEHDKEVEVNGIPLPTIELKSKIDWDHYRKFQFLAESQKSIPCAAQLPQVDSIYIADQKQKALINRLMRKSDKFLNDLQVFKGDREKVFYLNLARIFGGKVNAQAFEMLMEKLDLPALRKLRGNEFSIPSILFGMSGLLPAESENRYVQKLIEEFRFQKHRLSLKPMDPKIFRFSRMHPPGFPTLRLAQFAELLQVGIPIGDLTAGVLEYAEIWHQFDIRIPGFWNNHYRFERETRKHATHLSDDFIDLIVINLLVPYLFAIGRLTDDELLKEKSMSLLMETTPETNSIIRSWKKLGVASENAFETQALIEQKNEFCDAKRCLNCCIGHRVLSS